MKVCTKCGGEKELSEFHKNSKSKDGLTSNCKICRNTQIRNHAKQPEVAAKLVEYRKANKERTKAYNKQYSADNHEYLLEQKRIYGKTRYTGAMREKTLAKHAEYRANNKEKIAISGKRYREENKEKTIERGKKYHRENRDKILKYNREYRARPEVHAHRLKYAKEYRARMYRKLHSDTVARHALRKQATPAWHEKEAVQFLYKKRNELSKKWGIKLHVDHVIPLQGENVSGLHCLANLQLMDAKLNMSKGNNFDI